MMSPDAAWRPARSDPSASLGASGGKPPAPDAPSAEQEVIRRFHALYYDAAGLGGTWANTYWMGVRAQKCPLDLWIYQEILFELKPELIVECGTADGGSALFLAQMCDLIGRGEVVSIDVCTSPRRRRHPRLSYWLGSSTSPRIVDRVRRRAAGCDPVLVILDSDHRAGHVLQEMRLYAPLVTPGSYLIVEDTNVNGNPVYPDHGAGPAEAMQAFLREDSSFLVDTEREKLLLTFNPAGYLKKHVSSERIAAEIRDPSRGLPCVGAVEQVQAAAFWKNRASAAVSHRISARVRALALTAIDRALESWHTARPAENSRD
jgi:cephalosporin hydroxylase